MLTTSKQLNTSINHFYRFKQFLHHFTNDKRTFFFTIKEQLMRTLGLCKQKSIHINDDKKYNQSKGNSFSRLLSVFHPFKVFPSHFYMTDIYFPNSLLHLSLSQILTSPSTNRLHTLSGSVLFVL